MALNSLDMTDFDAFLKEFYPNREIQNLAVQVSPFYNDVKKTEYYGDAYIVPTEISLHAGGSHTFPATFNNAPATRKKFVVTDVNFYDEIGIDAKVLKASASNLGAFADARKREVDAGLKGAGKKMARALWRDAGGTFARLSGDPSGGTTFTVRNKSDAHFFFIGDLVEAHSALSGGTTRAGTPRVTNINRGTGVITVDATIDAAWADGDFLGVVGDYDTCPSGVRAWVPTSDPSATTFFGVDRTVDLEALSGWRIDGTAQPIWDSCLQASERVVEAGGDVTALEIYMQNRRFTDLIKEIGGKTQYRDNSDARIGKRSILVDTSGGSVKVTADPFVPFDNLWALDMSQMEVIYRPDGLPHLVQDEGLTAVRSTTADQILVRVRAYYQLVCWGPMRCATASLPTS